jgi:hypothetical protein
MDEDKTIYYALLVSVVIHAAVLLRFSYSNRHYFENPLPKLEVTYFTGKNLPDDVRKELEDPATMEERRLSDDQRESYKEKADDEGLMKNTSAFFGKFKFHTKEPSQITKLDMKRKISVPVLNSEKMANQKYLSYRQRLRQRIQERAYLYVDHPDFDVGEVYLTFVLLSDGTLRDIKISEDRTAANQYLRGVGLRSIKESSPFPPFPADLNYPELTFNVVISFEYNN